VKREEVYKAIDSERSFQDSLIADPTRPDMISDLHVGDTISAIEYNIRKAQDAWYIGAAPHTEAMKYLRKISALCVQAGERYDMPYRGEWKDTFHSNGTVTTEYFIPPYINTARYTPVENNNIAEVGLTWGKAITEDVIVKLYQPTLKQTYAKFPGLQGTDFWLCLAPDNIKHIKAGTVLQPVSTLSRPYDCAVIVQATPSTMHDGGWGIPVQLYTTNGDEYFPPEMLQGGTRFKVLPSPYGEA